MQNNEELSTYDYFCQTKMKEAFEIGKEIVVTDCDFLWKRLTKKKEKQYAAKADEENDKRKKSCNIKRHVMDNFKIWIN